jgi:hypothetical protein
MLMNSYEQTACSKKKLHQIKGDETIYAVMLFVIHVFIINDIDENCPAILV